MQTSSTSSSNKGVNFWLVKQLLSTTALQVVPRPNELCFTRPISKNPPRWDIGFQKCAKTIHKGYWVCQRASATTNRERCSGQQVSLRSYPISSSFVNSTRSPQASDAHKNSMEHSTLTQWRLREISKCPQWLVSTVYALANRGDCNVPLTRFYSKPWCGWAFVWRTRGCEPGTASNQWVRDPGMAHANAQRAVGKYMYQANKDLTFEARKFCVTLNCA